MIELSIRLCTTVCLTFITPGYDTPAECMAWSGFEQQNAFALFYSMHPGPERPTVNAVCRASKGVAL